MAADAPHAVHFMKAMPYLDRKTQQPLYSPVGYYASEKLDGQRAQWRPERQQLISRTGNTIYAPDYFLQPLRNIQCPLDGELFMGYGNWGLTGIFRSKDRNNPLWKKVQYVVFDIPDPDSGVYIDRMRKLEVLFAGFADSGSLAKDPAPVSLIPRRLIESKAELDSYYEEILRRGGEGVMLNNPSASYRDGRTDVILKYKPTVDDECVVMGYKPGNGKYTGKLGSFIVWPIEDGCPIASRQFSISGMKDIIRSNYLTTHPVGTVLRYCCSEMTKTGKPRHPVYLGKCTKMIMPGVEPQAVESVEPQGRIECSQTVESLPVPEALSLTPPPLPPSPKLSNDSPPPPLPAPPLPPSPQLLPPPLPPSPQLLQPQTQTQTPPPPALPNKVKARAKIKLPPNKADT